LSAIQDGQLVTTFQQYLQSVHIALNTSAEKAVMVYAAGSALTVGVALLVELVIILQGLPRGEVRGPRGASQPGRSYPS
jgi:hypothetical protein